MIASFIFAGAERAPERTAIVVNGRCLSYGEFARAIEAMVQQFESGGIGGAGFAVVAIDDLLEHWVVSLALRELGLTTVPVRSAANAAQLALPDVRGVFCAASADSSGLVDICAQRGWPLYRLAWGGALARSVETGRRRAALAGEHVVQTSATTGAYKLVLMARSFEPAFLEERRRLHQNDERSTMALFDFGAWTGVGYRTTSCIWLAGGAVVFQQGQDIHAALNAPGLTHAVALPDQLSAILAAPPGAFLADPQVRLRIGGGTPSQRQIDAARERITPDVWLSIGATETQVYAETLQETPEDRRWHRLIEERRPQIVDEVDQPLPSGEVGRIRLSTRDGPQGYLANPEATAAFFKDGYFYPGDLALIRADGRLALMGRTTDVINVMGQKLPPAPYEEDLREALGVADVCLFSRQDDTGDEEIHVAIETPAPIETAVLTTVLRRCLAGFPRAQVHFLERLPRNANGKVVRAPLQGMLGAAQRKAEG